MKDLYDQIIETVKQLKIKPCIDTYTELEKLLNRSIPSDGSEDVVKYNTFKMLLKSKAIIPGNIASNENVRHMALWMTPEMIVRHFDLQNYIELTFTQSNRFVQGDFIRGDYTVRESTSKSRESRESPTESHTRTNNTPDKKDEYTIVGSRKSTQHTTNYERNNKYRNNHNNNNIPRHSSASSTATRTIRYKTPENTSTVTKNNSIKRENTRLTKSYDQVVPESPTVNSVSSTSTETADTSSLRSSINWNTTSIKNWADEESDSD